MRFLIAFAIALFANLAPAQLPDWASVPYGPGAVVSLEQSWCMVREGNSVRVFSCLNRQWTTLLTLNAPSVRILNDAIIVRDGALFYGYSPRTGRFTPQFTWSPGATLAPQPSPQTWVSVVTDGNDVHFFRAIEGVWTTLPLSAPPTVTPGTLCALVGDGTDLYAVSAFYGTPVRLVEASGPVTVVGAFGNSGIATSANLVHGFSAYRNTWASTSITTTPLVHSGNTQAAFVSVEEPNRVSFFSGHTGTFTSITTLAAAPMVELQRAVAIVSDPPFAHGYSGLTGTTSAIVVSSAPTIVKQQFLALVEDAGSVSAFSATSGTFAPPIVATTAEITTRAEMATFTPTGATPQFVYSQFLNAWTPTPVLPNGFASVHETAASVVLVEQNGGLYGLSVRGTQWVHQPTPPIDQVYVGTSAPQLQMTLVARAGLDLWAFNSRLQAWRQTTADAPVVAFAGNNTALVLHDGAKAYGFSSWNDRWSTQVLNAPVAQASAQVQSAFVRDATHVHGFSGMGQTSTSHDYPEYWRAATLGTRMHVHLAAEANGIAVLLFGLGGTELPIPGIGTLRLDPAVSTVLATAVVPIDGNFSLALQVPADPALSGLELHFQSLVFAGASPYFTNAVDHRLL